MDWSKNTKVQYQKKSDRKSETKSENKNSNNNNATNKKGEQSTGKKLFINLPELEIPRDPTDSNYVLSFLPHELDQIKEFFDKYCFVVVRDVLSPQDCQATVNEVFDIFEERTEHKFDRNKIDTWGHFPGDGIERFGSPYKPPVFKSQFLKNRCNPNVVKVWEKLLGETDLVSNHDRCCLFRPTIQVPFSDQSPKDMPQWKTQKNLHIDVNPFNWIGDGQRCLENAAKLRYNPPYNNFIYENNQVSLTNGPNCQGVLNLVDNHQEDGGFIIIPGFKDCFKEFFANKQDQDKDSYNFHEKDPVFRFGVRIPCRSGSMIVWDQSSPHGSDSNNSSRYRTAQFIKLFPRSCIQNPERMKARQAAVNYLCNQEKVFQQITFNQIEQRIIGLN